MKKAIIIVVLLIIPFLMGFVEALTVVDYGTLTDQDNKLLVVDRDGVLYVCYSNDSKLYVEKSIDDGVTWINRTLVNDGGSYGDKNFIIQSNNDLWIFFWNNTGWDLHYNKSTDGGITWTGGYVKTYASSDYSINDMAVTVSNDDDIFVITSLRYDGPPTSWSYGFRRFRNATQTWNTWTTINDSQANFKYDICANYLPNGNIFITKHYAVSGEGIYKLSYMILDDDLNWVEGGSVYSGASTSYDADHPSVVVGLDGDVHIFYARENSGSIKKVYYKKYDVSAGTLGNEEQIETDSYDCLDLTSSYSVDDGPAVMWISLHTGDTTNEKMYFSHKTGGSWTEPVMVNIFNDDEMDNPIMLYQRYPDFCILNDGYAIAFENDTNSIIMFSYTGSLTFYGGTYGNGTTPEEYEVYCSGFTEYGHKHINYGTQYVEIMFNYEMTINITAFEIFMNYDYDIDTLDYDWFGLYVNNYYRGTPDEVEIWTGDVIAKLKWNFGDNPVSIESEKPYFVFRTDIGVYNLDLGFVEWNPNLESRFHENFALVQNGQLDGEPFSQNLPDRWDISCCYYYLIPEEVEGGGGYDDEEIPDDDLPDDQDEWGDPDFNNTFVEFYKPYQHCFYYAGDYAQLHYYLTNEYYTNGHKFYYYVIYKEGTSATSSGKEVYRGVIAFNGNNQSRNHYTTGYKFESGGTYYIWTYNSSDDGTDLGEIIHYGGTVKVCSHDTQPPDGGGGGGLNLESLPIGWRTIIGVAVTIMLTIIPLVIAMQMNKHHISLNIPSLVYVAFFFLGIITSVLIGAFDVWVLFVILLGIILVFAVTWLNGQKEGKIEEQE